MQKRRKINDSKHYSDGRQRREKSEKVKQYKMEKIPSNPAVTQKDQQLKKSSYQFNVKEILFLKPEEENQSVMLAEQLEVDSLVLEILKLFCFLCCCCKFDSFCVVSIGFSHIHSTKRSKISKLTKFLTKTK